MCLGTCINLYLVSPCLLRPDDSLPQRQRQAQQAGSPPTGKPTD